LATVHLILINGEYSYSFLNNHVERHSMAKFQENNNVKIHQAQIVKEWLGREGA